MNNKNPAPKRNPEVRSGGSSGEGKGKSPARGSGGSSGEGKGKLSELRSGGGLEKGGRKSPARRSGGGAGKDGRKLPEQQLISSLGQEHGKKFWAQLQEAAELFGVDRYTEAMQLLEPIAKAAPHIAEVRELYGLVFYRLGYWKKAITELLAFHQLTGTTEQHPVLCDCYRALHRWEKTQEVWQELVDSDPPRPRLMEGGIVYTGAMADQGKLPEAVALLEQIWGSRNKPTAMNKPTDMNLRAAYALGDLYDRASDISRAAALFSWIASHDPDFVDVNQRVAELGQNG